MTQDEFETELDREHLDDLVRVAQTLTTQLAQLHASYTTIDQTIARRRDLIAVFDIALRYNTKVRSQRAAALAEWAIDQVKTAFKQPA